MVSWLQSAADRCHQESACCCLFLLDAFVVLDLTVINWRSIITRNWHRWKIIMAQIMWHARVLLRWHVSSHSSNVIKCALLGSCTSAKIAGRAASWTHFVNCVALDWMWAAATIFISDTPRWFRTYLVWIFMLLYQRVSHIQLSASSTLLAGLSTCVIAMMTIIGTWPLDF